ncbi:MAG TPA: hypothetical protein VEC75_10495 [Stellaceae bacterium]|nr:hypothetical protein [Stellaceae bacterium]
MRAAAPLQSDSPNGSGAAAILAAGIGSAALGILAFAGDASDAIGKALNFYNPTGALSGVTTLAILAWIVSWLVLNMMWRRRDVGFGPVGGLAFLGLAVGFLLTFPPAMDLLQGK